MIRKIIALSIIVIAINSCKPDLDIPKPSTGSADMSRMIAVGDNYMAGYQDGALYNKGQRLSIPALIARQIPSAEAFTQPLMQDDYGIGYDLNPYSSNYVQKSVLGYRTDCKGASSLFPQSSALTTASTGGYFMQVSSAVNNFSVPFMKIKDYFNPAVGNTSGNKFYHRFASSPGTSTVYSDAKAANATFFTAWVGMADIFEYARNGGVKKGLTTPDTCSPPNFASIPVKDTILSSAEFSVYLDSLLQGLTANGAKGVIATIPDIESFPFYTLVPYDGLNFTQSQADSLSMFTPFHFHAGNNGFVIPFPTGNCFLPYRLMGNGEHVLLDVPLDSIKCYFLGTLSASIPDAYILDSLEMNSIHQAITSYNAVITGKAAQYNLALADMHQFFKVIKSGIVWDGVDINADFISGGFFSLDGYHPNQKGYALIATEFIKAINSKYGASLPPVYCSECDGIRFP
jgi:hypothetical protein